MTTDSHLPFTLCTPEPDGDIHLNVYLANHGHMGVSLPRDRARELAARIVELLEPQEVTNDEINARISECAEMVYRIVCAEDMLRAEKQAEVDRLIDRMLQLDARRTTEVAS